MKGILICNNIDEPGGHYAKWNKPGRERQILHDIIYMWIIQKKEEEEEEEEEEKEKEKERKK